MPLGHLIGFEACRGAAIGTTTSNPPGTALTPNASAHTKGSYAQLVASTTGDIDWAEIGVFANGFTASQVRYAIDFAIGSAGNEKVILPNLLMDHSVQFGSSVFGMGLPLRIPSGVRVSARMQCNVASGDNSTQVWMKLYNGAADHLAEGYEGFDAIGVDTSTTKGTDLTPGTSGSKGSYVQLTASTSRDYSAIFATLDLAGNAGDSESYRVDIAIGGSGSEVIVLPDIIMRAIQFQPEPTHSGLVPVMIPAGTRIAARASCSKGSSPQHVGVSVYGAYL